jgi:membrane-bound serine protease (ClpP class)
MKRLFISCLVILISLSAAFAQAKKNTIMVLEIRAEIDPRMSRYVTLALEHAELIKADYVIVDMNTFGGTLKDAKNIVDKIMGFKKPVWVYINSDAASAGALISIACDSIYMSPGASIGAATVVEGGSGQAAPDKYQSYMRSIMRSTAEENHRNPQIAEGMVDERTVIDSVKQAGKVITLTTSEAIKYGYCEAKVGSIEEVISRNGIKDFDLVTFHLGTADRIIDFFLNPFISGILILIILAGIYFEFQTPGASFPIIASVIALTLYLIPYYLNGLAEYWEILALLIGILLLLAEVFIIPGFGVAGIAGITLIIASLILIMLNNDFLNFDNVPMGDLLTASLAVIGGLAGGSLLLFFGGASLTQTKAFQRMALTDTQKITQGYTVNTFKDSLVGKKGIAYTVLRPSGKVQIDDQVYDAFTRGEYVEKGQNVEVVAMEGITIQVRSAA